MERRILGANGLRFRRRSNRRLRVRSKSRRSSLGVFRATHFAMDTVYRRMFTILARWTHARFGGAPRTRERESHNELRDALLQRSRSSRVSVTELVLNGAENALVLLRTSDQRLESIDPSRAVRSVRHATSPARFVRRSTRSDPK
ncbi:hypothetical protein ACOQFB_03585 [Anaeromyxobacter sp. Red801]|uniref:hypothetical protein n=1 Tax=Anaeromyxobacter sp. Red801 TaxID=3411632 RepID=UPI003B9EE790